MINKILVLFIFCVTCSLCRSMPEDPLVKEENIDGKSNVNHFSNHPPVNGKEIPVQVIYDAPTTSRPAKDLRALRTRGSVRYRSEANSDANNKAPEKELSQVTKTPTVAPVPIEVKTTESKYKVTELVTQKPKIKTKIKNADLQIPVSIVIDEMIHKVASRAERLENKPLVSSTTEKEVTKKITEEKIDTVTDIKTTKENKPTTEMPKKQTVDSVTSKEIENNTRTSKLIRQRDPIVPIIESANEIYSQTGKFKYSYEAGDGTKSFQSGVLKEVEEDHMGEAVVGGFSYKDKDGNDFMISYTADENGYRPVGAHLPTPPPVPPAIARALLYLATKTTPEPVTKSIQETE